MPNRKRFTWSQNIHTCGNKRAGHNKNSNTIWTTRSMTNSQPNQEQSNQYLLEQLNTSANYRYTRGESKQHPTIQDYRGGRTDTNKSTSHYAQSQRDQVASNSA
jgi:hypothetical protein